MLILLQKALEFVAYDERNEQEGVLIYSLEFFKSEINEGTFHWHYVSMQWKFQIFFRVCLVWATLQWPLYGSESYRSNYGCQINVTPKKEYIYA